MKLDQCGRQIAKRIFYMLAVINAFLTGTLVDLGSKILGVVACYWVIVAILFGLAYLTEEE